MPFDYQGYGRRAGYRGMAMICIYEVRGEVQHRRGTADTEDAAMVMMAEMAKDSGNDFYAQDMATLGVIARFRAGTPPSDALR
jgi:hypothetical protein